jgi:DNA-binding FadR family transcriptional regulator
VVESAAQSILAHIVDAKLQAGDELPALGSLARELGIGLYSTREAVQRLVALGVIELQRGKRMTVGRAVESGLVADIRVLDTSLRHQALVELAEVRGLLEPEVAALAAARATPAQLADVRTVVEEMRTVHTSVAAAELNSAFHVGVARGSGNSVAARLLLAMQDNLTQLLSNLYQWLFQQNPAHNDALDHQDICDALERHDAAQVRVLMQRHVQISLEREWAAQGDPESASAAAGQSDSYSAKGGTR